MKQRTRSLLLSACGLALAAAGTAPAAAHHPGASDPEALNEWALNYTGGTAGEASGDPITLGYVNQDALFPEATLGIEAAIEYVNAELGGAAGRPIELVQCEVNAPADGSSCGTQMANDDSVVAVLTGALTVGNAELYDALDGRKPVLIGNGLTIDDFVTTAGVSFFAGAPGVLAGLAKFVVEDFAPETVAVVYVDNAAGQASANLVLQPALESAGVSVTLVGVPETATAPDVASAMQAAGADTADVFVSVLTVQGCVASYDAIESLGIDPVVVTTGICFGTPMTDHLRAVGVDGEFPDGWYSGNSGYSILLPDYESGMETYLAKMNEYGEPVGGSDVIETGGFAVATFANLLTMARFVNELGADGLDVASLDAALRGFTGPMMMQAGPLECGLPPFAAVCAHQIGVSQYRDGEVTRVRSPITGNAVDVTPAPAG